MRVPHGYRPLKKGEKLCKTDLFLCRPERRGSVKSYNRTSRNPGDEIAESGNYIRKVRKTRKTK